MFVLRRMALGVVANLSIAVLLLLVGNAAAYNSPVGIPAPPFGIDETTPNSATRCPNWPAGETAGCYYIDSTHGSASDTSNTYGYPDKPRRTIPGSYAAGSYVVVAGGPYNPVSVTFNGTASNPVFFTGRSDALKPTIHGMGLSGSYGIVEYIHVDVDGGAFFFTYPASYLSLRYSSAKGSGTMTGNASAIVPSGSGSSQHNNNIVIFRNTVWDQGQWNANTTSDVHGIKPRNDVDLVWILENTIYHVQGDSIQTGEATLGSNYPTKIYIGRNTMYENKENCVDIKGGTDIVVSENICHDMLNSYSDDQMEGIVTHNSADWTWYINNTIWNCGYGIYTSGSRNQYAIGNVIYGMQGSSNPSSLYDQGAGILMATANPGAIVNNTINNSQHGFSVVSGGAVAIANNIISNRSLAAGYDQSVENTTGHSLDYTLTSGSTRTRWGGGSYTTASAFNSATGQGAHYLEVNPQFVDAGANDYRLSASSLAIDHGVLAAVYSTFLNRYGFSIQFDRNRSPRPSGTAWDIGAFEGAGSVVLRKPLPPTGLSIQ